MEEGAGELRDAGAGLEDPLHLRASKIEIAVLEAGLLADLLRLVVVGQDRGRLGLVEDLQFGRQHLDLARVELRVRAAPAGPDHAPDRDHVLASQALGGLDHRVVDVGAVEDDLGDAAAVAKIDEHQRLGVVSIGVHPAGENDGLADVVGANGVAVVRPLEHGGGGLPGEGSEF